jgi:hypothetical protein
MNDFKKHAGVRFLLVFHDAGGVVVRHEECDIFQAAAEQRRKMQPGCDGDVVHPGDVGEKLAMRLFIADVLKSHLHIQIEI